MIKMKIKKKSFSAEWRVIEMKMAEFKKIFIMRKSRKKWKKIRKLRNEIKQKKEDFINEKEYIVRKNKKNKRARFYRRL